MTSSIFGDGTEPARKRFVADPDEGTSKAKLKAAASMLFSESRVAE